MRNDTGTPRWGPYLLRILPFGIAASTLAASLFFADALVRNELAQLQARSDAEAKHVASQVRVGVQRAFDPLQRIAAWWLLEGRPLAPEDWDSDAQLFVSARSGLEMMTWVAPGGQRAWSVRPGRPSEPDTNEPVDAELARAVDAARRYRAISVSPIFDASGQASLWACAPVLRGGRLVGFVGGRYRVAALIRSVLQDQLPPNYSVTVLANGREIPVVAIASRSPETARARETAISLANAVWAVRIMPSGAEILNLRRLVISFGVLISILLYACTGMALVARRRARQLASANEQLRVENGERQRAEEKIQQLNRDLQRRLQEFQVLLDVLPIGIAVAEQPECRQIWINRSMADLLRVPAGQNISKSAQNPDRLAYQILHNGTEVPIEDLPMQLAARTGMPVGNQELDIVRQDGSVLHTLSYAAPVFDETEKVRGVINACIDITDRKRAEEERRLFLMRRRELEQRVERAERYRSLALMAGGIAHDFNNLLTVIIGHANLLTLDVPLSSGSRRNMEGLQDAANRAAQLTSQLLAFTGKIWWEARPVDFSAEVRALEPAIREMLRPGNTVHFNLATDLPVIHAGVPELQQVIHHLLSNAVEALEGRTGRIDIRTSQCDLSSACIEMLFPDQQLAPGRYVKLEIADNGCGIPEDSVARVFDPFFTTKFVGRGLGLSAVQGVVRAHGGGIRLESSLDRGTRVEIILPAWSSTRPSNTSIVTSAPLGIGLGESPHPII
jgi:signal transduction histidine kinase